MDKLSGDKPTYQDLEQRISFLEQELACKNERLAKENAEERERNIHNVTSNFETFFNTIDDFLFVLDEQGTIIHCNKTVEKRLGYTFDELKGNSVLSVHPEERRSEAAQTVADMIIGKADFCQIPLITKQGKHIHVETRVTSGTWNGESVLFGVSKDITKLKLSEEKFSAVFYLNPSACGISESTSGRYIEVNDAFYKLFGYTKEETIGHTASELHIMTGKTRARILSKADSQGRVFNAEAELLTRNGEKKRVLLSSQNINVLDGAYRFTVVHDVTEIYISRELAEQNEKKFSLLFNACPEPLSVTSLDEGRFIMINEAFHKVSGFERDEVIDHTTSDLNVWTSAEDRQRWIDELSKNGSVRSVEYQFRTKKYGVRDFLLSSDIIEFDNKKCALIFYIDITDRKNAEIELLKAKGKVEESEEKFKNLFESLYIAYIILKDGVCIECNEAAIEIYGVNSKAEIIGKSPAEFSPEFQPNNVKSSEAASKNMQIVIDKGFHSFEWLAMRKNKEEFYADVSLKKFYHNNELYMQCVTTDITQRKRVESELLAAKGKAEDSDHLKTAFLQNMSHEIRTPLNAISGFSGLLNSPDLSQEKRSSFVSIIQNSSEHLISIVSDILTISSLETKQEEVNISNVCINHIIIELLEIFKRQSVSKNVSLFAKQQLTDKQSEICTDKSKITQILSNLLSNALKFTHIGSIEFGYELINNELEFYVRDSGIGIKPELHEKIFERFRQADKTIQANYGGTGLGLSICKGFVELLGGKIWVQSQVGEGSTFYFTIPYRPVSIIDKSALPDKQRGIFKTIVVAEDDEYSFLYIKELLADFDCNLIHTKDGQETVETFKSNPNIDLILMDIKMPVMTGDEAARIIKSLNPNLPIVAQSAYVLESEREKFGGVFDDYLAKPIKGELLADMISKFLDVNNTGEES